MATDTSAEHATMALRQGILEGTYAGGSALRQDHLARAFNVSQAVIREALRALEANGLVSITPRRGARVVPLDEASTRENTEMRSVLMALAMQYALPKIRAAHIAEIEHAQDRCDKAASLADWDAANRAFHRALIAPCEMPRLLSVLDGLEWTNARLLFAAAQSASWRTRSNHDHRLILQALKARDNERAANLLSRHVGTMERIRLPVP